MNNIILKTTDKRILYFYNENGICVKNLTAPSEKPKMIFDDAHCDFDAVSMENGDAGIICQDKEGSIIFLRENSGGYLKSTLLKNKSQSAYNKRFNLLRRGKWICAEYIIDYDNKKILSFQIVDRENQIPDAVDEVNDSDYFSFSDRFGNIFLFYNREDCFGYRIFNWGIKEWSEFVLLGKGRLLTAVNDFEDNYYIACEKDGKKGFLFIEYENDYRSVFVESGVLSNVENICLINENNNLWLVRENSGNLYGQKLSYKFEAIGRPMFFGSDANKKYYKIKSNEKNYKIYNCWGYEKDRVPRIILFKDLYDTSKVIEDTQMTADEEITSLKTKSEILIEDLAREIETIKENMPKNI